MNHVFIEKHQAEFSIKAMCRVLKVTRSSWHQRRHQINRHQQFRLVCDNVVREAFSDAEQRYGTLRLTDGLRAQGLVYNIKIVAVSLRWQRLPHRWKLALSARSYRSVVTVSHSQSLAGRCPRG